MEPSTNPKPSPDPRGEPSDPGARFQSALLATDRPVPFGTVRAGDRFRVVDPFGAVPRFGDEKK